MIILNNEDYKNWILELKSKIKNVQIKAAITVNKELLMFYWELGADIINKQKNYNWGDNFLQQLSKDLISEFPQMKGFSIRNLEAIRQWRKFWDNLIPQQVVAELENNKKEEIIAQLFQIPWGQNLVIISKCKNYNEAIYYVNNIIQNNWSRSVLIHQIENGLYQREGKAINNFELTLPKANSDLARETLKDPYIFDFLTLTKEYTERDLENSLVEHITKFLLELGAGFAYIGRQVKIQVGERDFYIDLLFYHTRLHCYVVIELKTVEFEPEHAGKLNFYIKAVDEKLRQNGDEATIGILLCKSKDKFVAEYALSDINKPIGVSEYQLTQSLPENLKSSLPTIEELELELLDETEGEN